MKQKFLLALLPLFFNILSAQTPQGINYQAVIRDSVGVPLAHQPVSVKMSFLSDTLHYEAEYAEIHTLITDAFGRVNLQIGRGEPITGNFSEIPWAGGNIFLRTETDPEGGTNFQLLGQSQLLSVPYAFFAEQSGNSLVAGEGINIDGNTISNAGDLSNTNELQVISISHDTLFLSNGGFAKLPPATHAIVPPGSCIQSTNPQPPEGYNFSGTSFTAGDQWYEMPQMTHTRFGAVVVALQNQIYVIGGWDGIGSVSNIVEVFDVETGVWSRKTNMHTAVVYGASAVVGNNIHVMGGYTGSTYSNRHQVFNTLTNSWSLAQALPQACSGAGATAVNGDIFLVGGFNDVVLNTLQMYDPATDSWTSKTAMPTARTDFAMAQLYDGFYVVGGWNEDVLNVNEFYHPATDTWTTWYPSATYRAGASAAVAGNRIYLFGGGNQYNYSSITEMYDPLTNEWKTATSLPSPRSYFGAVSINNIIYVVGGNFGNALQSMYKYNPETIQYFIHCAD